MLVTQKSKLRGQYVFIMGFLDGTPLGGITGRPDGTWRCPKEHLCVWYGWEKQTRLTEYLQPRVSYAVEVCAKNPILGSVFGPIIQVGSLLRSI